jgi:hypothetical protein
LTLSLARAAYMEGDPRSLLTRPQANEHDLRVHLLDQVFAAAYADPGERAHATYWLSWLAHKMGTQPNGPIRDLGWWQVPGWIARWRVGLVAGLLFALVFGLGFALVLGLGRGLVAGLLFGLVFGLKGGIVCGLLFGLVGGLVVRRGPQRAAPHSVTVRWDLRGGVWFAFVFPFVLIFVAMLMSNPDLIGLIGGLVLGLLFGLPLGLMIEFMVVWRRPVTAAVDATPSSVYQKDVQSQLLSGLVFGLGLGLPFGFVGCLAGAEDGLGFALVLGLGWLIFGLALGLLGVSSGAASLLLFTELALWRRTRRVRFMPLLETALKQQVLRQAGAVYQFRHADLQDRLAEQYGAGVIQRQAT